MLFSRGISRGQILLRDHKKRAEDEFSSREEEVEDQEEKGREPEASEEEEEEAEASPNDPGWQEEITNLTLCSQQCAIACVVALDRNDVP